jgi:SAM-dependent methyltransferase
MTFESYAAFYDTLYETKDYARECDFVESIFAAHARKEVRSVLDLGCGTGGHAFPLSARGYEVVGVDRSEAMLSAARAKADGQPGAAPEFVLGDIQSVRLGRDFDAVLSLFAVMSYQTSDDAVRAAFATARAHLSAGGLFVFDAWFGPGVMTQPPAERQKTVETESGRIHRFARPRLDLLAQVVAVHYQLYRETGGKKQDEVNEVHEMRFFFPNELRILLQQSGFRLVRLSPFLDLAGTLAPNDWNFTAIAEAV